MAGPERKAGRSPPYVLPTVYDRRLPHIQPNGRPLFVTWALAGVTPICKKALGWNSDGAIFAERDRALDKLETSPRWLADPRIAEIVRDFMLFGQDRGDYELGTWVIMPNHVHMLITPYRPLWAIMREIKSGSARYANKVLSRDGQRFWQHEYFDRVVRNEAELARTSTYVERNPVCAGLCNCPEAWQFSSAHENSVHRAWPGATPFSDPGLVAVCHPA
jgi:REP element-mobilizing transposase RayT